MHPEANSGHGHQGAIYRVTGLSVPKAAEHLWRTLQDEDDQLGALPASGCGELVGIRLRVRFVRDAEDMLFACEVINLQAGALWEAGFAKRNDAHATFWRRGAPSDDSAPEAWKSAVVGTEQTPLSVQHQPSFISLVGAYFGTGGFSVAENLSTREALEGDLGYWRELGRAQARVIDELERADRKVAPQSDGRGQVQRHEPVRQWKLREIAEWAALHSDRIVILPRAISAARKSEFQEPELVFSALDILASDYAAAKKGIGPRDAAKNRLAAMNMEIGGSVDPSVAGSAGDDYFVHWRGRRRFLDQHLKKGTSRDPRYTLRIYFTWDEELQKPVVGWLPSHLDNSRT